MPSQVEFTYQDYSREKSRAQFNVSQLTAANFDAINSSINTLSSAILAVQTENTLQSKRVTASNNLISRAPGEDKATQRESKWLLTLEDTTLHSLSRHEVPQADTQWVAANSDFMNLASGPGLALKSAVEAVVKSPAGNAVVLLSVQFVGKRL